MKRIALGSAMQTQGFVITAVALALVGCGGGGGGGGGLPLALSPAQIAPAPQPASEPAPAATSELTPASSPPPASGPPSRSGTPLVPVPPIPISIANSGSVSAKFIPGGNPNRYLGSHSTADGGSPTRYLMISVAQNSFDTEIFKPLTQSDQAASGAMVRLNDTALSGKSAVQEISGDASFALGRWVTGTVTRSSGKDDVLTGDDKRTYHYLAFNEVPNIPGDGTPPLICDSGIFTTPTYLDSGPTNAPISGAASGSATVTFGPSGASITGAINVTAGGGTGTMHISSGQPFNSPSSNISDIINMDNTTGNWTVSFMLGDGDINGTMMLAVRYIAVMLPSRARYTGLAKLNCRPKP